MMKFICGALAALVFIEANRYFNVPEQIVAPAESSNSFPSTSPVEEFVRNCRAERKMIVASQQDLGPWTYECI